jgi:hypothetical protein
MFIIQKQKLVINDNGGVLKGFIGEGTIWVKLILGNY